MCLKKWRGEGQDIRHRLFLWQEERKQAVEQLERICVHQGGRSTHLVGRSYVHNAHTKNDQRNKLAYFEHRACGTHTKSSAQASVTGHNDITPHRTTNPEGVYTTHYIKQVDQHQLNINLEPTTIYL